MMLNISPEQKKIFRAKNDNEREMLSQILLGKTFKEVRDDFNNKFKESLVLDDDVLITSMQRQISSSGDQILTFELTYKFVGGYSSACEVLCEVFSNSEWMQFISDVEMHDVQFYSEPMNQYGSGSAGKFSFHHISPPRISVVMRGKIFSDNFMDKLQKKMDNYRNWKQ